VLRIKHGDQAKSGEKQQKGYHDKIRPVRGGTNQKSVQIVQSEQTEQFSWTHTEQDKLSCI
jgi:hypothetical protein